ncbi:MAG: TIGR01777 family oxidoreductase [Gemmatimonadaceae bacterium]
MRVLVSGSSGMVGTALISRLESSGDKVTRLARRQPRTSGGKDFAVWDPEGSRLDVHALEGHDAVVHLAGESISHGRWTAEKKKRIRESRVRGTQLLSEAITRLSSRPEVLVCASAVGYYGDRGDEILTEESGSGSGFLAEVCREWEAATEAARRAGIRVVILRFGMILSPLGGALKTMLPIFRMGLGGTFGDGRQWMSWIALQDVVETIVHVTAAHELSGPVNTVSPNPVRNEEFTEVLGRTLHRPTFFVVPAVVARLALGDMAQELLLASARVVPRRLEASGFKFRNPDLAQALRT